MTNESKGKPEKAKSEDQKKRSPEWATGLKQLYDSVVDEPLPDSFRDLLTKLDSGAK